VHLAYNDLSGGGIFNQRVIISDKRLRVTRRCMRVTRKGVVEPGS
jgi:hypothetical protein